MAAAYVYNRKLPSHHRNLVTVRIMPTKAYKHTSDGYVPRLLRSAGVGAPVLILSSLLEPKDGSTGGCVSGVTDGTCTVTELFRTKGAPQNTLSAGGCNIDRPALTGRYEHHNSAALSRPHLNNV